MKGDKVRIQQLVYILLDNAVRYTKEGSITCSLTLQGKEIVIGIKDTGPGIPQDDISHIFDRFYRGDLSRKRWFRSWSVHCENHHRCPWREN
uniref:ATP-binding protein n=1 Tax=Neobacillus sp. FSL H8-0543 TaxID=2954672 RepID=UPI00406C57FF